MISCNKFGRLKTVSAKSNRPKRTFLNRKLLKTRSMQRCTSYKKNCRVTQIYDRRIILMLKIIALSIFFLRQRISEPHPIDNRYNVLQIPIKTKLTEKECVSTLIKYIYKLTNLFHRIH